MQSKCITRAVASAVRACSSVFSHIFHLALVVILWVVWSEVLHYCISKQNLQYFVIEDYIYFLLQRLFLNSKANVLFLSHGLDRVRKTIPLNYGCGPSSVGLTVCIHEWRSYKKTENNPNQWRTKSPGGSENFRRKLTTSTQKKKNKILIER